MDVDYYALPRPVQDRFADATRSIGVPGALLRERAVDRRPALWAGGAAVTLLGLLSFWPVGFGELASPWALAPTAHVAVYGIGVALLVFSALRALGALREQRGMPYEPGLYLFPVGVIDARGASLRVFRHPELRGVEVVQGTLLRVATEGGTFEFRAGDAALASAARDALGQAATRYEEAVRTDNQRECAMLDPLIDSGFSSPFSPQQRLVRGAPVWVRLAPLLAAAAGAVVGPAAHHLRNVASEHRIYAAAAERNDAPSYRAYLARGGGRPEVAGILLPRAELREAVALGTVEAIEAFAASHPGTQIQAEVDAALAQALRAELGAAVAQGTATALRELSARRRAHAQLQPAIQAAQVALYRGVLQRVAEGRDPAVAGFLERLLGHLRAAGPRVALRFVRRRPESMAEADSLVKRSAYFMGKQSVPSQYFEGDFAARREAASAARISAAFGAAFPADVLALELVPGFEGNDPPPALDVPVLDVEVSPEMAGGYMNPKPRGVFVGVGMRFKIAFRIPGSEPPLELKSSQWRAPNLQLLKHDGTRTSDVYDRMAAEGFDRFHKTLLGALFGASP